MVKRDVVVARLENDAVAAGLAVHIADPHAHRGVYRVKEDLSGEPIHFLTEKEQQ